MEGAEGIVGRGWKSVFSAVFNGTYFARVTLLFGLGFAAFSNAVGFFCVLKLLHNLMIHGNTLGIINCGKS